jgi:hypothetical protein
VRGALLDRLARKATGDEEPWNDEDDPAKVPPKKGKGDDDDADNLDNTVRWLRFWQAWHGLPQGKRSRVFGAIFARHSCHFEHEGSRQARHKKNRGRRRILSFAL